MTDIKDIPANMLRAWADAGVISSARYVEEIERRHGGPRETRILTLPNGETMTLIGPPLDYELDAELAIPFIHRDAVDADEIAPMPKVVIWVLTIAAVSVIGIALWVVWP